MAEETGTSLDAASRVLGAPIRGQGSDGSQVTGEHAGQPVVYTENLGRSVIVAPLPGRVRDLILNVFPETEFARRQIEGGRQIDVITGDHELDAAFVIEAAPSDVVTALLDPPLRSWLMSRRPDQFAIRERADDDADVRVELDKLPADAVAPAIEVVARFARGLSERAAKVAADLELATPRTGAAYRGDVDEAAIAALRRTRQLELAALRKVVGTSDQGAGYLIVMGLFALLIGFMILLIS